MPKQTVIFKILSDMDAEISALEEKLSNAARGQGGNDVSVAGGGSGWCECKLLR
ncbi:MAG: hypothetical protein IH588_08625 [Anaerolineales bacterium]|nr:hypothetical protein [Anaerolineales bacterium]